VSTASLASLCSNPEEGNCYGRSRTWQDHHYFSKIGVAAIQISHDTLRVGDTIHVKGHTTDFAQKIDSMQIDGKSVAEATIASRLASAPRTTPANTTKCSKWLSRGGDWKNVLVPCPRLRGHGGAEERNDFLPA